MRTLLCFLLLGHTFHTQYLAGDNDYLSDGAEAAQVLNTSALPGDSVYLDAIPSALFWIDEPLTSQIKGKDAISIKAAKGTDLYTFVDGSYYINNAPKLLFAPDSNFVFSAKITPEFSGIYDGGAILIYTDSLNWAKLLFEKLDENTLIIGSSVISNKKTDDSYHLSTKEKALWLKVGKSGKIFNFYHSFDGQTWHLTRTFHYNSTKTLKLGFYAQSPKGPSCTVHFSDIRYKGEGFADFFTGE